MKYITEAKVREIIELAEENFQSLPDSQTDEEVLASVLSAPTPQEAALTRHLESLTREEVLELLALMYIGQFNVHGGPVDIDDAKSEFSALQRSFVNDDSSSLVYQCASKNLVLHTYLKHGLRAASAAGL
jgi:hypothetical protein